MYIYTFIYIHIYIHVHAYIYICICLHTHTHTQEGESYKGDFLNGHEHGQGVFTSLDGSHYCGTFKQVYI